MSHGRHIVLLNLFLSAQFLHDEDKVYPRNPEKPDRNVREYCYDFAFQAIQELL